MRIRPSATADRWIQAKETVSRITDRVLEEMAAWQNRPRMRFTRRSSSTPSSSRSATASLANRPVYAAIGVTLEGEKDVLGLWAGTGGEGAKFWMSVLKDIKNRGVKETFFLVCDGLKGLPEVVSNVWPLTTVQTCIIHLIRNTFRLASKKDWDALKRDVKPIYTAVNATAARAAFEELTERWGRKYGAIVRLWDNAWEEFIPFLDYDVEIWRVICSTNAIESLNARYRRAVKARGHFPTERLGRTTSTVTMTPTRKAAAAEASAMRRRIRIGLALSEAGVLVVASGWEAEPILAMSLLRPRANVAEGAEPMSLRISRSSCKSSMVVLRFIKYSEVELGS
ncbi:IS256 family transposase [Pseudarthrobacter sp. S9]|uniref:IS256 family transposase n=1 Tax=Pseudarthrobacter sp. S9 TaxID=3418421 RepID=UPI003D06AA35